MDEGWYNEIPAWGFTTDYFTADSTIRILPDHIAYISRMILRPCLIDLMPVKPSRHLIESVIICAIRDGYTVKLPTDLWKTISLVGDYTTTRSYDTGVCGKVFDLITIRSV